MTSSRKQDRRKLNVSVPNDRRGKGQERRKCPECSGALKSTRRSVAGGSVTSFSCESCGWSSSSRQTDADLLLAKMTWSLPLEKKASGWQLPFPPELVDALKLKSGDQLVLSPLTLPVGSLPMRWAITVQKKK
jgi:hypothetical protein